MAGCGGLSYKTGEVVPMLGLYRNLFFECTKGRRAGPQILPGGTFSHLNLPEMAFALVSGFCLWG